MKKLKIKKKYIVVLIVFVIFVLFKLYHFMIINKAYHEVMKFMEEENRYFSVIEIRNNITVCEREIYCKNNQVKYLMLDDNWEKIYFELKNFETNELYTWNMQDNETKVSYDNAIWISDKKFILNVPNTISRIYQNNKLNLKQLLKVHYIVSTKYEGKSCYKIVTKTETIIVDKETHLPKYVCRKLTNSDENKSPSYLEYVYEFKINTVTEEDMQKM